ncbi:MAG: DsrE family protein [Anaerolineales bacterium]|jgi:sulfur relay (sulfurtransferase) complex TusBCD TusD component (DsrE family)|nr:DsrE family protein [Anaerolineales bacterium]
MKDTVILCTRFGMGQTDLQALSETLITKFFSLLLESGQLPPVVCFYTDGVRLTTSGSPVLEQLKQMEAKGVRLIVCSTCLDAMGLADQVQAGIVGGMTDIIEAQIRASKVITL